MSAPNHNPQPSKKALLAVAGLSFITLIVLLFRVSPRLAFALICFGLGLGIYWVATEGVRGVRKGIARYRAKDGNDFGLRVEARRRDCLRQEERFRSEAEDIRRSIATLRADLDRSGGAESEAADRARRLIKEFDAEFNLRLAKAAFFADCANKLQTLRDRYTLQQSIAARKQELDHLRSTNFDDEAQLEETRYHLEREGIELATIEELSREAFVSAKAEQAEALRLRLEKLRGEL